jgi:hypothetical protein
MSEVFSRVRIAASARQAVIAAQEGRVVGNPHIEGSAAAAEWDIAFERYSSELAGCEACA